MMDFFQLLSPCVQAYLIDFLDLKTLYQFAQVSQSANGLAVRRIKQLEHSDLIQFAHMMERILTWKGFTTRQYRVSQKYNALIEKLKHSQIIQRDELNALKRETFRVFFEEFNRNSLGYQTKGLVSSRHTILASLQVPEHVQKPYCDALKGFIENELHQSKNIMLNGNHKKVSHLFFSILLKVLASKKEKGWNLTLAKFSLTDEEALQLCLVLKTHCVVLLNLSGNAFTTEGLEKLLQHFSATKLIL